MAFHGNYEFKASADKSEEVGRWIVNHG